MKYIAVLLMFWMALDFSYFLKNERLNKSELAWASIKCRTCIPFPHFERVRAWPLETRRLDLTPSLPTR